MNVLRIDCAAAGMWSQVLDGATVRQLVRACRKQAEASVGAALVSLASTGARGLNALFGGHYAAEIEEIAELGAVSPADVLFANLAYDFSNALGCSTMALATREGPLHARNLDWPFPGQLLRHHTTVIVVEGAPAGRYAVVTWPGLFGALTGVAPGRFSVTVNYVTHRSESGISGLLGRALKGYWPVPWAIRRALDTCRSFEAAVRYLQEVELLSPVLLVVAGARNGERVIIERTGKTAVVIRAREAPLFVTNHYQSEVLAGSNIEGIEGSEARLEALVQTTPPTNARAAFERLSRRGLIMDITQHQVVLSAAKGELRVRVPGERARTITLT